MKRLFGTDGMRGEAGKFPLDKKTIEIAGRSLARQFKERLGRTPRFVTGRDTRESGEWIEKAFHSGAAAEGAECKSAGVITTPGVAFLTGEFKFDAGIVISASHNPFQDNGIKIFSPSGKKIDEETERQIEAHIDAGEFGDADEVKPDNSSVDEFQKAYLAYLANGSEKLSLPNFKIVLDCANGAASALAPRLFAKFAAGVTTINNAPDGRNINKGCGSLHLEKLQEKVLADKADFGVAFDGDADRSLFVDEKGNVVDGDAVMYAMALYLKRHGKLNDDTVVATVMSNLGLETALSDAGISLLRTSVGDKYVLEELLKTDSSLGGEQSGHIIFPALSLVGDGMRTAILLLEAIMETGQTFSQLTAGFKSFPQVLVNVRVGEKKPFNEVPEIAAASSQVENELGNKGRLLLRYSGTENLARVMIEGENQAVIEEQANRLASVIKSCLS